MSNYFSDENRGMASNFVDINVKKSDVEIRADVVLCEYKTVRIWGQVRNCDGEPIPNALVKLLKVINNDKKIIYKSIASTVSDSEGFYQFDLINVKPDSTKYRVLVGKCINYNTRDTAEVISANSEILEGRDGKYKNCDEYDNFIDLSPQNRNERKINPYCGY